MRPCRLAVLASPCVFSGHRPGVHGGQGALIAAVVVYGGGRREPETQRLVDDVEVGGTERRQWNGRRQLDRHQVNPRVKLLVPDLDVDDTAQTNYTLDQNIRRFFATYNYVVQEENV